MPNPTTSRSGLPTPTADEARQALTRILASVPERELDAADRNAVIVARYIVATDADSRKRVEN